ncbi:hypothetical protein GCM10027360_55900 [Amycolatopsis echigonensis]
MLGGHGAGGQAELAADGFGEVAHGVAFVGDCVHDRARFGLFEDQAEQPDGVEVVHGGPARCPPSPT